MAEFWKEYISYDFTRPIDGLFSWQHLLLVGTALTIMFLLAFYLGKKNVNKDLKGKLKVLKIAAFVINGAELIKIIFIMILSKSFMAIVNVLPLFICSIQLIAIPIAAFSKGRIQEAFLDFVFMLGGVGAVLGTVLAGNTFNVLPTIHFHGLVSVFTHCVAGFCSLYIGFSRMQSMKKENIWVTSSIMIGFIAIAETVNIATNFRTNYMFLVRSESTPFSIVEHLTNYNKVAYPIVVTLCMIALLAIIYGIYYLVVYLSHHSHSHSNTAITN